MINYNKERTVDYQYQNLIKEVLKNGEKEEKTQLVNKESEHVGALFLPGSTPMKFRLSNGFPIITERNISSFWKFPIGELFGFINGARTQEELEKFGCSWWKSWVTEKKCSQMGLEMGDLGHGSYGVAFHDFPMVNGETFNQFKNLVEQIKEIPHLRTHIITPFIPEYIFSGKGKNRKVVVVPCHGLIHVRIVNKKLTLTMVQRSGDILIGVPSNMIQYAALTLALAKATGYEAYEYVHTILDAHIYLDQIPFAKKLIKRKPFPFPRVKHIERDGIFDYRKDDFSLFDYKAHPSMPEIPVAI
ncbi:MAG: thymidylate synthase [Candidatus Pacebacteria bacterium]|nr:thymidylate synthase [Candidatus Paceibacterota bacterium]